LKNSVLSVSSCWDFSERGVCVLSDWLYLAAGLFHFDHFAALIVPALGAGAMRQFTLVTVGAFRK
jgi:hypothetical protein